MRITRRQFIQYVTATAAALGISQTTVDRVIEAIARPGAPKVIWLSGQACGGCIEAASNMFIGEADVTDANGDNVYDNIPIAQVKALFNDPQLASSTTVEDVIIDVIDLKLMNVINTPSGDLYTSYLKRFFTGGDLKNGNFVVVVEGSVPKDLNMTGVDYCGIAHDYDNGDWIGIGKALQELCFGTGKADAVIAYGTCAAYGNIPAARNVKYQPATQKYEHTFAMGVGTYLDSKVGSLGSHSPVVNIPVCPGHPEALALTVVDYLTYGLSPAFLANLDSYGRPKKSIAFGFNLYGRPLHQDCPRLQEYSNGLYSSKFGQTFPGGWKGCLYNLGCQGQWTYTPCHSLKWNRQFSQTNCISAGIPCVGCGEKGYPDKTMAYRGY